MLRVFVLDLYGALQHFITHVEKEVKKANSHAHYTAQQKLRYCLAAQKIGFILGADFPRLRSDSGVEWGGLI